MAATEESEDAKKRQVLDTPGLRSLIAKVKRGDKENADAIAAEIADRTDADVELITSLEDETDARRVNDELLQQQIEEVAVQTDWEQDDSMALDYLKNKPTTITDAEIEALFI